MRVELRRGKLVRGFLVAALLAVGGGFAGAAETKAQGGNAEAQAETPAGEDQGADDGPPDSHDVFLPTEEISEDFAVPFPVDI